ncbi:hypothetical protein BT96DRAFT_280455 [Gymnopus androsaceus JB14]|uniref:BZIP domain-containing protein n=1 Tax=Gymnopus androsaceus JB14 TaxID=1447944 RepID=A0A6A4I9U0_9AGAR|nr:hypothetical protein BT96DRAFT_280455 [Gymnopus androsaceus JB14]
MEISILRPMDDSPFISDLNTPIMDQIDDFDHSIVDPNSGWMIGEAPLFNDSSLSYYQSETAAKEPPPAELDVLNSAKLYSFSPSTPALEDFHSPLTQPVHSPAIRPAPSLYSSARVPRSGDVQLNRSYSNRGRNKSRPPSGTATGTRRDLTPASMVPLDAPTQTRNYVLPSSTSRKDNPLHAQKRSHSQAFSQAQEQDELTEEAPPGPNATEIEHIAWRRRQNTIAARKSRRRKLEHQLNLEAENKELRG